MVAQVVIPLSPALEAELPLEWGDVYALEADFVWRCLLRMGLAPADAEDALQEVFLVVQRRLGDFDPAKGALRAWLVGIAGNIARAEKRKKHRQGIALDDQLGAPGPSPLGQNSLHCTDGSGEVHRRTLRASLRMAVESLDPEHRIIFTLFEIEGASCSMISEELKVPVGTVHSRLHSARKKLKKLLHSYHSTQDGTAP